MWRSGYGIIYGPVLRLTVEGMNERMFKCTVIPIHFHVVPAIIETFILSWDNISDSPLMEMREA